MKLNHDLRARYLCLKILLGVFKKKKTVSQTLEGQYLYVLSLESGDVARAKRFSDFIFVHLRGIDESINFFLKKKIKLEVRNLLRLVVAEAVLAETPDYAIVNSAVKLSKFSSITKCFTGLVNAVSRKILQQVKNKKIKIKPSLDENLKIYLSKIYSEPVIEKIERLMPIQAPVDLTVKEFEETAFWKRKLDAIELPFGTLRLRKNKKLSLLDGYQEGKWWVQGISSSLPVKLLGNVFGLEVLDLFSAPGGKAMQLISAGAEVTCLDRSTRRIETLKKNLIRMNMKAKIITEDFLKFKAKKKYDIILIDAPCSSSGTLRKNKEIHLLSPVERMIDLESIQRDSLKLAKNWVKSDGIILYCTCSLFPAEGEKKIEEFLISNENWTQKSFRPKSVNLEKNWLDERGGLRLRPDHLFKLGGMDGFYAAMLVQKTNNT